MNFITATRIAAILAKSMRDNPKDWEFDGYYTLNKDLKAKLTDSV